MVDENEGGARREENGQGQSREVLVHSKGLMQWIGTKNMGVIWVRRQANGGERSRERQKSESEGIMKRRRSTKREGEGEEGAEQLIMIVAASLNERRRQW